MSWLIKAAFTNIFLFLKKKKKKKKNQADIQEITAYFCLRLQMFW